LFCEIMKSIVQLLRSKIIPWTTPSFTQRRLIVTRLVMQAADLPDGVTIATRELVGERKVIKARRKHGNQRFYTAFWPKDNLQETTVPRISCVVSGMASHRHGKYIVRCGEGNFLLIPPGMPHQQFGPFLEGKERENGYCVLVHAYAYRHGILFWQTTSRGSQHINAAADNFLITNTTLAQLLTQAVEEAVARQTDAELICNSCLTAFFAVAAREIEMGNCAPLNPQELPPVKRSPTSFTEEVQEYIEANCHRMIKTEDVARHVYMSNSHFFREMHKNGINFTDLLTRYRMEQACRFLRDSDLTVREVANKVSYKSSTYFQNLFRARMGCTPLEYRHQVRKETS